MPAKVQYVARVAYVARVSQAFWTLDSMQLNLLWTKAVYVTAAYRVNVLTGMDIQCFNCKYEE
jgi:hypothetical protein